MARTIVTVHDGSAEQRAAAAERSKRRFAGLLRAQDARGDRRAAARQARAHVGRLGDGAGRAEETFAAPPPRQVIKLSAGARIDGSRVWWRGRLRGGGADVLLESAWMR